MQNLTPRQRVMRALRGEKIDFTPFTVYECFIRPCTRERKLRERGMCVVYRTTSYERRYRGVSIRSIRYTDEMGQALMRTEYSTPVGMIYSVQKDAPGTVWTLSYPFKSADDYPVLRYLFAHAEPVERYGAIASLENELGEDFLVRDCLPLEPMQELISGGWMNPQDYALEWYDNRDELLQLYELSARYNRKCYEIVASGPFATVNYGGNVVPQIIGRDNYRAYYMPHYEEAAGILHKKGKLIGCHYDADNTPILADIAQTSLDYIEAYDPVCSPALDTALPVFRDKAVWINWPSAWHLKTAEFQMTGTQNLMNDARSHDRFLVGITEDVPPDGSMELFERILSCLSGKTVFDVE